MTTSRSTPSTARKFLHIAVGVVQNDRGEVLVCQRPPHKLYPGEWEFPGGKVEPGEPVQVALARELREELGIEVEERRPLIRVRHVYPELSVDLDTWLVTRFRGTPVSTEHPATAWVAPEALPAQRLLAADRPIVNALRLPAQLVFTPPHAVPPESLASRLATLPPCLLRLRVPELEPARYRILAQALAPVARGAGRPLLLDRDPADVGAFGAAGFHATAARLRALTARPVPDDRWFGASCHTGEDVAKARALGADYVVIGAVRDTPTHPDGAPLGWDGFAALAQAAERPAYAIGGMRPVDLPEAWARGGQGIAGISAYWGGLGTAGSASASSSRGSRSGIA